MRNAPGITMTRATDIRMDISEMPVWADLRITSSGDGSDRMRSWYSWFLKLKGLPLMKVLLSIHLAGRLAPVCWWWPIGCG